MCEQFNLTVNACSQKSFSYNVGWHTTLIPLLFSSLNPTIAQTCVCIHFCLILLSCWWGVKLVTNRRNECKRGKYIYQGEIVFHLPGLKLIFFYLLIHKFSQVLYQGDFQACTLRTGLHSSSDTFKSTSLILILRLTVRTLHPSSDTLEELLLSNLKELGEITKGYWSSTFHVPNRWEGYAVMLRCNLSVI